MARKYNTQNELEEYIDSQRQLAIDELKGAYIVVIKLFASQDDTEYDDVYQEDSGINPDESQFIRFGVLFQIDAWSSAGYDSGGTVESGHIYTNNVNVIPGKQFKIVRTVPDINDPTKKVDELSASYEIKEEITVGKTRIAERKWRVMSLPD